LSRTFVAVEIGWWLAHLPIPRAVNPIVREIHAMDPTIPVYDVRTMEGRMYDSLARQRSRRLCWAPSLGSR
jgi:hypothetical protein